MHVCFQNSKNELLKNNRDFIYYDSPGRISLLLISVTNWNISFIFDRVHRFLGIICQLLLSSLGLNFNLCQQKDLKEKKVLYHIVIVAVTATVTAPLAFLFSLQSHGQAYYWHNQSRHLKILWCYSCKLWYQCVGNLATRNGTPHQLSMVTVTLTPSCLVWILTIMTIRLYFSSFRLFLFFSFFFLTRNFICYTIVNCLWFLLPSISL